MKGKILFSRILRKNQTDAEKLLWAKLRSRRFNGLKFRRQQLIGEYIVDFVCFEQKLIIELDGSGHNEEFRKNKDRERTSILEQEGFRVLRF